MVVLVMVDEGEEKEGEEQWISGCDEGMVARKQTWLIMQAEYRISLNVCLHVC